MQPNIGDKVKWHGWTGVVKEVFSAPSGRLAIRFMFVKNGFKGQLSGELQEFGPEDLAQIEPASVDEILDEAARLHILADEFIQREMEIDPNVMVEPQEEQGAIEPPPEAAPGADARAEGGA